MFKNQTPRQLSFFIAILSATALASLTLLLRLLGLLNIKWSELALLFIAASLVGFVVNFYLIRYFIFRRIKLIYKIIHRRKLPQEFRSSNLKMGKNILDNVEQEVDAWMEQSTKELEELERLATYRRRFIGDVSHELKTPIFNIQGFVHTLLDGALYDPEVNENYLKRAAKNIERLQSIVEELETINKLESGQMVLELQEFDLYKLAEEVYADLEVRAKERNIRFAFKDGASQHYQVRADKESIRQVLINLVHNSIKYGTEGGLTKISFYDMESYVLVEVSDTGIGISQENMKHVFDRFYRVDKSRSRDAGGTGLGLSIVKHIVEAHKQTINVRSTEGKGSTFGFTLEKV
jgi:two-component system, OmpR family, phosphate regulon sensor histidine kinase PhoR